MDEKKYRQTKHKRRTELRRETEMFVVDGGLQLNAWERQARMSVGWVEGVNVT